MSVPVMKRIIRLLYVNWKKSGVWWWNWKKYWGNLGN